MDITIPNWEKYNPRNDVKSCSWFRMSNDFFSDPDFYGQPPCVRLTWIFVLSCASKKISGTVRVHVKQVSDCIDFSEKDVSSALNALQSIGCVALDGAAVKSTRSNPDESDRTQNVTFRYERTNEQTNEHLSGAEAPAAAAASVTDMAVRWVEILNRETKKNFRPSKTSTKDAAARIKEGFTEDDCFAVCSFMWVKWGLDPKMRTYLRPQTLFGTKFDSYLQEYRSMSSEQLNALMISSLGLGA